MGPVDSSVGATFIFGWLPVEGLSSLVLVREDRLALRPEHHLADRTAVNADDLRDLPWLRVPAARPVAGLLVP